MDVTVIDYGIGNLLSITRALEHCGAHPVLTNSPTEVEEAKCLILPGVGAFADGMQGLRNKNLIEPIRRYAASGRPLLGICLGMQMLLDYSEEFGRHEGLQIIPGRVAAIPVTGTDGNPHKVPHIGWNGLKPVRNVEEWGTTLLKNVRPNDSVYFVHSYTAWPLDEKHRLADTFYDGRRIAAVIRSGAIYGCQFHPEKSGPNGIKILKNFIDLSLSVEAVR